MTGKILFTALLGFTSLSTVLAQKAPGINSVGLPDSNNLETGEPVDPNNAAFETVSDFFIAELIQFVAVAAVIALILSGIQLILSGGEEEKMKKARKWFIWSLAGVVISLMAFFIINFINNLNIA